MFARRFLISALFATAALLAACGVTPTPAPLPTATPTPAPAPTQVPEFTEAPTVLAGGLDALVVGLQYGGATVELGGEITQPFFSVPGRVILVNGAELQVFEYLDEAAREAESSQISPTGSPIGTTMITWVEPPHFWATARIIVLYVGSDEGALTLLNDSLGAPLAEGAAAGLPPAPQASFEAATYRDEAAGFELQYPASWTLPAREEGGDRGEIVQAAEGGEPRLDIVVLRWDPTRDLDAFLETRKTAWNASGMTVVSEEDWLLGDEVRAVQFVVQTATGEEAYFFFTEIGERYLQLSGSGDLELLKEIGGTVRLLGPAT